MKTWFKSLFTKPYGVFYSDLSPIRRAWLALWERPRGNHDEAVEMNKELIKKLNWPNYTWGQKDYMVRPPQSTGPIPIPETIEELEKLIVDSKEKLK